MSETIDGCPETGEPNCQRCSGEYCETHGTSPCDCAVDERHREPSPPAPDADDECPDDYEDRVGRDLASVVDDIIAEDDAAKVVQQPAPDVLREALDAIVTAAEEVVGEPFDRQATILKRCREARAALAAAPKGDDDLCRTCGYDYAPRPNGKCWHCDSSTEKMTIVDLLRMYRSGDLQEFPTATIAELEKAVSDAESRANERGRFDIFTADDFGAVVDALRGLRDEQDGPPSKRRRGDWESAVGFADKMLAKYEPLLPAGDRSKPETPAR